MFMTIFQLRSVITHLFDMRTSGPRCGFWFCLFMIVFISENCMSSVLRKELDLGFDGDQTNWINNEGLILVSNNSNFAFGFWATQVYNSFLLVVLHKSSKTVVWSANRGTLVTNSDKFVFDNTGNALLQSGGFVIWSTDTAGKGVASMKLLESGNLVLVDNDSRIIWQSFSHPADSLLSNQAFSEGMKLVSNPNLNNLSYTLEIKSGDMILSASFQTPQPYWAIGDDNRKIIKQNVGKLTTATIIKNAWNFYDQNQVLIWYLVFSENSNTDANASWVAVLEDDGFISFTNLLNGGLSASSSFLIPQDQCSRPAACDPYFICYSGNECMCPSALPSCKLGNASQKCQEKNSEVDLVDAGDGLSYFALGHVPPSAKTSLNGCKNLCLANCSCVAMFFDSGSGSCYVFDEIGNLRSSTGSGPAYDSYIKISSIGGNKTSHNSSNRKHLGIIISIVCLPLYVIICLLVAGYLYLKKKNIESSEDSFLEAMEGLSGMPVRFTYKDLQTASNNFSIKLGQGGFGSVYQGSLPDGTQIAVKKLEGIGQGMKEFRAEVSAIGSIRHHHLVRLRGFCADGSHRMLVYEYMANGSLDKWLFRKNNGGLMLDWDTRYYIALGTAKGLAYLHEECDVKIVHCDIKPENVLIDGNFLAKVSDFGLAKLMTREQSHVCTTLRGTRGYLAPEWVTNYRISEKSDVYSYGMVLLEIIGGRRNFVPAESSEKTHFPTYAFKMMEEGRLRDIIDANLRIDVEDERILIAIKVALWCIQVDISLRPPMRKVVQMLQGISPVLPPPKCNLLGAFTTHFTPTTEIPISSGPSAVRLSGPR